MSIQQPTVREVGGRVRMFCPILDCPHAYATEAGYLTKTAYIRHFERYHLQSEKVGLFSRLDYGNPGFRQGLLKAGFEVFLQEKVRFVILAGGLVSFPHLRGKLTTTALDQLWEETWGGGWKGKKPPREVRAAQAREHLFDRWTNDLAAIIPHLKLEGKFVKIYIVTSPAPNYDGWLGTELARRLTQKRPDIRFWGERSGRFPLKNQNKVIWVLTPKNPAWRGRYYSTPVDRLIEDEERRTSHPLPDLWVVGCTAASLHRPAGENPRPSISLPALHLLQEVHTSENQVGVRVVEFSPQRDVIYARTYDLKSLVAKEERWIPEPEGSDNPLARAVVAALKVQREPKTIGMLEDTIKVPRVRIADAIKDLNSSGYRPEIVLDENTQLYHFDKQWIQRELRYPPINLEGFQEDVILAFGCLHAGSVFTQLQWFIDKVPEIIIRQGSRILIGAGDFIQGLEHHLIERGEVMGGLNYTHQEILAAELVAAVIVNVFRFRLAKTLGKTRGEEVALEELTTAVREALLTFVYIEGNHEEWLRAMGVVPLTTFHSRLIGRIIAGVSETLKERGLAYTDLEKLVAERVVRGRTHKLPSGLEVTLVHPFMARALTSSLRAQHALGATNTQIVVIANFHVAVGVEQWGSTTGQRVCLQVGTLLSHSKYEEDRLKRVDTGVAHLRTLSQEGRIAMSEIAFFGPQMCDEEHSNEDLLMDFMRNLGIPVQ